MEGDLRNESDVIYFNRFNMVRKFQTKIKNVSDRETERGRERERIIYVKRERMYVARKGIEKKIFQKEKK